MKIEGVRKGSYIFGDDLLCRVEGVSGDILDVYVINGNWYGRIHTESNKIEITPQEHFSSRNESHWTSTDASNFTVVKPHKWSEDDQRKWYYKQ